MDRRRFEALVEEAFQSIPRRFRSRLHNVAIVVEDEPSADDRRLAGVASGNDLLGLYHGVPLPKRDWTRAVPYPDRISIYQRPIERAAADGERLEDLIADTLWHEVGHYFGLNEAEVRRIDRQRAQRRRAAQRMQARRRQP
jgi:predicted Zn-dependent protease with MMP-like domain